MVARSEFTGTASKRWFAMWFCAIVACAPQAAAFSAGVNGDVPIIAISLGQACSGIGILDSYEPQASTPSFTPAIHVAWRVPPGRDLCQPITWYMQLDGIEVDATMVESLDEVRISYQPTVPLAIGRHEVYAWIDVGDGFDGSAGSPGGSFLWYFTVTQDITDEVAPASTLVPYDHAPRLTSGSNPRIEVRFHDVGDDFMVLESHSMKLNGAEVNEAVDITNRHQLVHEFNEYVVYYDARGLEVGVYVVEVAIVEQEHGGNPRETGTHRFAFEVVPCSPETVVLAKSPVGNSPDRSPPVRLELGGGLCGIDPFDFSVTIDGSSVDQAQATHNAAIYSIWGDSSTQLADGTHTVEVTVKEDCCGVSGEKRTITTSWQFTIGASGGGGGGLPGKVDVGVHVQGADAGANAM